MKLRVAFVLLLAALVVKVSAQATLSVQGTIQKSFGGAVDDGDYSLTFRLYTAESGGTLVWEETQDGVEVIGGVYSVLLGEANPLNAGFNTVYYLGIAVDGGAELIPRTKLTSAPYALSLIGQSNTFPSAGSVGVGTVTPEERLHVNNTDGHARQIISTSGDYMAGLRLKAGNYLGSLDVDQYAYTMRSEDLSINIVPAAAGGKVYLYGNGGVKARTEDNGLFVQGLLNTASSINAGNGNFHSTIGDARIYREGDLHMLCRGDGYTEFKKALFIPGNTGINFDGQLYFSAGGGPSFNPIIGGNQSISIQAVQAVMARGFIIGSDARIKTDLKTSDPQSDLSTLMSLEVTDYRRVDSFQQGNQHQKGFIAQQVEKVFPEAVSISAGVIPDIYAFPVALAIKEEEATFVMEKTHGLSVGSRVRIYASDDSQQEYEVIQTDDEHTFTVSNWHGPKEALNTFVFGKEVDDFRKVDYDKIHTLNVSATQELVRRVAQLEADNATLRQRNQEIREQNQGLRSEVNSIQDRMNKLENLLISNAQR